MIYGIISPTAKIPLQESLFSAAQTVEAELMTAIARPYGLGASRVKFEIVFCTAIKNEDVITGAHRASATEVWLTSEEMTEWGTEDSALLHIVATKLGTAVQSTVVIDGDIA